MTIDYLADEESGGSCRSKINQAITQLNGIAAPIVPTSSNLRLVNLFDFGATPVAWDGTTDSSSALDAAIAQCNAIYAAGDRPCLYIPPGMYYLTLPPRSFVGPGSIIGCGQFVSMFRLSQTFAGDVFQWSETWALGGWSGGNTNVGGYLQGQIKGGVHVSGIGIWGDRRGSGQQNGLMFYDSNDYMHISDIALWHLKGYAIATGKHRQFPTRAYCRESVFQNIHIWNSGSGIGAYNVPSFDTDSNANGEGANEIRFYNIQIFSSHGIGFRVQNSGPGTGTVRNIFIDNLRVEGMQVEEPEVVGCDSIVFGHATAAVQTNLVHASKVEVLSIYTNAAGIRCTANGSTNASYGYEIEAFIGGIGSRTGTTGLSLDAIRNSRFVLSGVGNVTNDIYVGPSTHTTGPCVIEYAFPYPKNVNVSWNGTANRSALVWAYPEKFAQVTYDPGSLADGAGVTTTVTVNGAALGDFARASFSLDLQGITLTAWVSSTNTVSVRFQNESGGVLDLASGTLTARVS